MCQRLQRRFVGFAGTNTNDALQFSDEDFAVANFSGVSRFADDIDHFIELVISNRHINFYFWQQDPVVLADTFLANVTLGRDISEERVWQALETVQLAELARSMSDGIYTPLGEQGNNLSVGQKQLLALARVLVETPQILILDEATASIDSGTEQAIQHALAAVREHTTLVVIAHRLSTIVDADTILVLHRGQAVEQGTHQQLLAAQGRYWQMYQLQLAGEELAASVREEESLSA